MRLLNVKTEKFEEFHDVYTPPYAILSHRWGNEEMTFQDVNSGSLFGWRKTWPLKLKGCLMQAKKDNLSYIWADTCCIDKTNSVELGEAINSMFNWYRSAAKCYAYLSDVAFSHAPSAPNSQFRASSWFTRGWTLQELLAPKEVHFYSSQWEPIGTKDELSSTIEEITTIPRDILLGWVGLREASIAQRMSWAARRVTTRTEDLAYCLLGLFGVTMPMIYGEKGQAFMRLQLEIIKNSDDHSILAWGFRNPDTVWFPLTVPGGALAPSPAHFAHSGKLFPCKSYIQQNANSFELVGGSLRMQVPLARNSDGHVFGLLNCGLQDDEENLVGIPLDANPESESVHNYFRPAGRRSSLFPRNQMQHLNPELIYIKRDAQELVSKSAIRRNGFYIDAFAVKVKLTEVVPGDRWITERGMIRTWNDYGVETHEEIFLRFTTDRSGDDFVVILVPPGRDPPTGHAVILSRETPLTQLAKESKSIKDSLYGYQSCSNGQLGVSVSIKQAVVAGQGAFILKLAQADVPMKTINATHELELLRKEREERTLGSSYFGPHLQKNIYLSLLHLKPEEGVEKVPKVPDSVMRAALLCRAVEDINRVIQIRAAKQSHSVGDSSWEILLKTEKQIEQELREVIMEANALAPDWGSTIFQSANEIAANTALHNRLNEIQEKTKAEKENWEKRRASFQTYPVKEISARVTSLGLSASRGSDTGRQGNTDNLTSTQPSAVTETDDYDDDLYYLRPGFDPASLTVPGLRSLLTMHNIRWSALAKKPQLVELFNQQIIPQAEQIRASRTRSKRTTKSMT